MTRAVKQNPVVTEDTFALINHEHTVRKECAKTGRHLHELSCMKLLKAWSHKHQSVIKIKLALMGKSCTPNDKTANIVPARTNNEGIGHGNGIPHSESVEIL